MSLPSPTATCPHLLTTASAVLLKAPNRGRSFLMVVRHLIARLKFWLYAQGTHNVFFPNVINVSYTVCDNHWVMDGGKVFNVGSSITVSHSRFI